MSEEAYIKTLPRKMQLRAAREGLDTFFASFRCDYDIAQQFDEGVLYQLWAMWNKVDPRYLSIRLLSASDLPAMDGEGVNASTDAYAIAYIVPPDPDLPTSPLKAAEDPLAVDTTLATPDALDAKPGSPLERWTSPCLPWNSRKATNVTGAGAVKPSLLTAVQEKRMQGCTPEERAAIKLQAIRRGALARRTSVVAGGKGAGKFKGWALVRQRRRSYSVAKAFSAVTAMPSYACRAAWKGDIRLALTRLRKWVQGSMRMGGGAADLPRRPRRQARAVRWRTLARRRQEPQPDVEARVDGAATTGRRDERGRRV